MFLYPDLFLKVDVLNDSSSENFSDDNQIVESGNRAKWTYFTLNAHSSFPIERLQCKNSTVWSSLVKSSKVIARTFHWLVSFGQKYVSWLFWLFGWNWQCYHKWKCPGRGTAIQTLYMSKVNAAEELMIGWLIEWKQWKVLISLASKSNAYSSRKSSQFWQTLRSLHCWRCTMGVNLVDHKLWLIRVSSRWGSLLCIDCPFHCLPSHDHWLAPNEGGDR